jgi:hypothetical protein
MPFERRAPVQRALLEWQAGGKPSPQHSFCRQVSQQCAFSLVSAAATSAWCRLRPPQPGVGCGHLSLVSAAATSAWCRPMAPAAHWLPGLGAAHRANGRLRPAWRIPPPCRLGQPPAQWPAMLMPSPAHSASSHPPHICQIRPTTSPSQALPAATHRTSSRTLSPAPAFPSQRRRTARRTSPAAPPEPPRAPAAARAGWP